MKLGGALFAISALLVACGGSSPLVGTWVLSSKDTAYMFSTDIDGMDEGETIEFRSDGTFIFGSNSAEYEVLEDDRVRLQYPFGSSVFSFTIDGDELVMETERSTLVFERE
jgi:hypothetical protein